MAETETFTAREPAWRLFAAEFNESRHETSDGGERSPTYVITPLGGRVNRVLVVGVLTANDAVGEDGNIRRAQVTDPTGVFHIYAGQYQPEALQALSEIEPPAIVAVVGKSRTYSPQEGVVYTSIRPELIQTVGSAERDAWIVEAAEHTLERIEAVATALELDEPTEEKLGELGLSTRYARGILDALDAYGNPDLDGYRALVSDALGYLMPEPPTPQLTTAKPAQKPKAAVTVAAGPGSSSTTDTEVDAETVVFELVATLDEDEKGAPYEELLASAGKAGLSEEQVEEAMNTLMDQGRIFEPVLGRLKHA